MARNINCDRCKRDFEELGVVDKKCSQCKHWKRTQERARKRSEKGLPPWGSGEKRKDCLDCGEQKEDRNQSCCNKCRSVRNKAWALKTGRVKRHNTGLCPCGAERAKNQPYYCSKCKAADSRRYRAYRQVSQKDRDRFRAWYSANKEHLKDRRISDAYHRVKLLARSSLNNAVISGVVVRGCCEVCGASENVEGHHDDYTKPLDVRWLCREHHKEVHLKYKG